MNVTHGFSFPKGCSGSSRLPTFFRSADVFRFIIWHLKFAVHIQRLCINKALLFYNREFFYHTFAKKWLNNPLYLSLRYKNDRIMFTQLFFTPGHSRMPCPNILENSSKVVGGHCNDYMSDDQYTYWKKRKENCNAIIMHVVMSKFRIIRQAYQHSKLKPTSQFRFTAEI